MKLLLVMLFFCCSYAYPRWATHEDLSYALINADSYIKVKKDGTYHGRYHFTYKVLKDAGKEKFALYKIPYSSSTSQMELLEAKVVNGKEVIHVPLEKMADRFIGKENGIDDGKEIQIAFPQIQKDSLVTIVYEVDVKKVPVPNHFSMTSVIGPDSISHQDTMTIESELPLHHHLNDPFNVLNVHKREEGGKYFLKIGQKAPYLSILTGERGVPSLKHLTFFKVTSEKDWSLIGSTFKDYFEKVINVPLSSELDAAIKEAGKRKGLEDKVNYLTTYIVKNYNYVGDWRTLHGGFRPRELKEIIATKHGDCKDFATLLTFMLRKLSINANVSLIERSSPISGRVQMPEVPMISMFNHAIVRVREGEKSYWVDPTNMTSYGLNHREDIAAKYALVLDEKSALEFVPLAGAPETSIKITKSIALDDKVRGKVTSRLELDGPIGLMMTGIQETQKKEHIDKIFINMVSQGEESVLPQISAYDLKSKEFKKIGVEVNYQAQKLSFEKDGKNYLLLPSLESALQPFNFDSRNWEGDLYLGQPQRVSRSVFIKGAFLDESPRGCYAKSPWFEVTRTFDLKKEGIKVEDVIFSKGGFVPKEAFKSVDYDVLLSNLDDCVTPYIPFQFGIGKHSTLSATIEGLYSDLPLNERVEKRYNLALEIDRDEVEGYTRSDVISLLRKNIEEVPSHGNSYSFLSRKLMRLGFLNGNKYSSVSIKEALDILDMAKMNKAENINTHITRLFIKIAQGNLEELKTDLEKINLAQIVDLNAFANLASLYSNVGNVEMAIKNLQKAEELATTLSDKKRVAFSLAYTYSTAGNNLKCVEFYKKHIELDTKPKNYYSYNNITSCLLNLNRNEEAVSMAKKGHAINPRGIINSKVSTSLASRGHEFLKEKKYDLAEKDFTEALQYTKDDWAYLGLGLLFQEKGQHDRAVEIISEGATFSDNPATYLSEAAKRYLKFPKVAVELYKRSMKSHKNFRDAFMLMSHVTLGFTTMKNAEKEKNVFVDDGIALGEALIKKNPNDSEVLFRLGQFYYLKNTKTNWVRAKDLLRMAQGFDATNTKINRLLDRILKMEAQAPNREPASVK